MSGEDIIRFLNERLGAHEGGAPSVNISYDDATFCYMISQKKGFGEDANAETLGCSRSIGGAFSLAISGKVYEEN